MKKILAVLAVVCVALNVFCADDWAKYNALTTAEGFVDYAENQGGFVGRAALCLTYADALNNPTNYTTFEDYRTAYLEKANTLEGYKNGDMYALYSSTLKEVPTPQLYALRLEAYNYLMTLETAETRSINFYMVNDVFCKENNITSEDRFNTLIALFLKYNFGDYDTTTMLKTLNSLAQDLDEEDVVKAFKKLHRKFYPKLTGAENDPNLAKVNYIANILKAYGYDVNK